MSTGDKIDNASDNLREADEIPLTVFISYARSEEYDHIVLDFCKYLSLNGIAVTLDRYVENQGPPEGWPVWMLKSLNSVDFVLILCTKEFHDACIHFDLESPSRKGVRWESIISLQDLYDRKVSTNRYIPILLDYGDYEHIPKPIKGHNHYVITNDESKLRLIRNITCQPEVEKPKLGSIPVLNPDSTDCSVKDSEPVKFMSSTLKFEGEYSELDAEFRERLVRAIINQLDLGVHELIIKKIYKGSIIVELYLPDRCKKKFNDLLRDNAFINSFGLLEFQVEGEEKQKVQSSNAEKYAGHERKMGSAYIESDSGAAVTLNWESIVFADKWQKTLESLCLKRFYDPALASEASIYVIERLAENEWERLKRFSGKSKPETYFISIVVNCLEEFARKRFGRPRPPAWLKKNGPTWVSIWKMIALERLELEVTFERISNEFNLEIDEVRKIAEVIKAKMPWISFPEEELSNESKLRNTQATVERENSSTDVFLGVIESILDPDLRLDIALRPMGRKNSQLKFEEIRKTFLENLELTPEDLLILKLVYRENMRIKDIATGLRMPEYQLNKKLKSILLRIKNELIRNGVEAEEYLESFDSRTI